MFFFSLPSFGRMISGNGLEQAPVSGTPFELFAPPPHDSRIFGNPLFPLSKSPHRNVKMAAPSLISSDVIFPLDHQLL